MSTPAEPHDELLAQYTSERKKKLRKTIRKVITRPVIRSVVDPRVEGEDNVRGLEGAYIVVGNHSSHLDAPMVFSLLPDFMTENLATGAAADYFYRKKVVSKVTSAFFNTYPVERGAKGGKGAKPHHGGKAQGMTGRLLRAGIPILIFPEGTRSRTGTMGTFKPGAAALAIKIGVPIVPLAMVGGHEAMPVGKMWPTAGHPPVKLFIGRPMWALPGDTAEEFIARVARRIQLMYDQESAYVGDPAEDGQPPVDGGADGAAGAAGIADDAAGDANDADE